MLTCTLLSSAHTAWKVSKDGVFSGPYFPIFGLNTGKYGQEKTPYLDTFHAVVYKGIYWPAKILSFYYIMPFNYKIKSHFSNLILRKRCPYSELFWSVFSRFGLNMERSEVSLRIQSECGKMWTRITPNTDNFYAVLLI